MDAMETVNLTHHFLIAMPAMADPHFNRALIYVCEHNSQGALGVIVNRPIDLVLAGLFEKVNLELEARNLASLPVYFGGPVQMDRGFVLHRPQGQWQSSLRVNNDIGLTSSKDILVSLGKTGEPQEMIVTLGYAGWGAGQLENELGQNAWLTVDASPEILFHLPPEERLPAAMQKLGISFSQLSTTVGHA
ncbi:MAG: YqgE/AlgH family protein [Zoogloeaceae bacterium]|jgi:putative transcriptional regulator|nr:YqgE/AlgH family protein [Zoogloeaceae bacterium]